MLESSKSSNTTELSERPITEFGPWNTGIVRWRKQKREERALLVQKFLTDHGSTRLCSGDVQYKQKIRCTCASCGAEKQVLWKDLIASHRVWCKSCAVAERMQGVKPSLHMLQRAAQTNREGAERQRALRLVLPSPVINLTPESVRSQVRRLAPKWTQEHWRDTMRIACRVFQRCTNPRASNYAYYGGRGISVGFASTALMADWLLQELGPRPEGATLDRINTNGHYTPGNLRWASIQTQMTNRNSWRRGT